MTEHGAVALFQRQARAFALRGDGLGDVDGDETVIVRDEDLALTREILLERECQTLLICWRCATRSATAAATACRSTGACCPRARAKLYPPRDPRDSG